MSILSLFRSKTRGRAASKPRRRNAAALSSPHFRPVAEALEPRRLLSADPIVQNPMGSLLLDDGDPQPDPIPLLYDPVQPNGVFFDSDPGDVLSFEIVSNTNPELVSPDIVNDELWVMYADYDEPQDRTPAQITVRATDLSGGFVDDTLTVTVQPITTVELAVVVRSEPTPESEFTFFSAFPTPSVPDPIGFGRFQLDNGSLRYTIDHLLSIDLDGTVTPLDDSDDLTGMAFYDAADRSAPAFDILGDDDLVIDGYNVSLQGVWESGSEGFENFVTSLYNRELFVWVKTVGNPSGSKVSGQNIAPRGQVSDLPESLTWVEPGNRYTAEVWVKDVWPMSAGLSSVVVDLHFDNQLSTGDPATLGGGDPFIIFVELEVDNNLGVASLGGGALFPGAGLDPAFGRVGYLEFEALAEGDQVFTLDVNVMNRQAGPNIDLTQIEKGSAVVVQQEARDTIGVFRDGRFYLDFDADGVWDPAQDQVHRFGQPGDKPVVGDWDGDGIDQVGTFRPSNLNFYLDLNGNGTWDGAVGGDLIQHLGGRSTDTPLAGDWNGDGVDEIGLHRNRTFLLDMNGDGHWNWPGDDVRHEFGAGTDTPITGEFSGDLRDDIGVYRPSNHKFYLDSNGNGRWDGGVDAAFFYRDQAETPIIGDFNGDGADDPGTHAGRLFYLDLNANGRWDYKAGGDTVYAFGSPGDTPITGIWKPPGAMPRAQSDDDGSRRETLPDNSEDNSAEELDSQVVDQVFGG